MRWEAKAGIQKVCAVLPGGATLYRGIQKRFGRLDADPFKRLPPHAAMVRRLAGMGFRAEGSRCLEIGTGHLPVAPVAFGLLGAREVVTVDLHRRIDSVLTGAMLRRLVASEDQLLSLYAGLVAPELLRERLAILSGPAAHPLDRLERLGVRYVAPGDAARMPDPADSFDLSFSMTVLEHVTPVALRDILTEARRVLRPDGFAAHLIDPSDHFAHQDPAITRINFLRFSARQWHRIGGNEFAYCNRLRAPALERVFTETGFDIAESRRVVDERCRAALDAGFEVHPDFRGFSPTDLCTTEVEIYARPCGGSASTA